MAEDVTGAAGPGPDGSSETVSHLPVTSTVLDAETARPIGGLAVPNRADRARRSAYRFRFVLFYFGLALVAGSAIGAFVVVLSRPKATPAPPWSAFVPTGSDTARLYQIITQIPKQYRGTDGKQLVAAAAAPPQELISPDGQTTALIPIDRMQLNERGNITNVSASGAVQFTLTGNGANGIINSGTASRTRYDLLQREALELSFYAFRYIHDVNSVTVLLPPSINLSGTTTQRQDTAVFLQRDDVKRVLARPLQATLPSKVPSATSMSAADVRAIESFGIPHTYTYTLIRAQDGTFVRVLAPPSS